MFSNNVQKSRESTMNTNCAAQANLKRSSSAPMINEISSSRSMNSLPPTILPCTRDTVTSYNVFSSIPRIRRFSMSNNSIGTGLKLTPRVNQLRQEECIDAVFVREAAHEKEIHSTMQISQSWEDLTFETESLSCRDLSEELSPSILCNSSSTLSQLKAERKIVSRKTSDSFTFNLASGKSPFCISLSPTRSNLNQQNCYSPNFHIATWKNSSLSPSPTRKAFATRRSLSPISIRPSSFSNGTSAVKRKFELDGKTEPDCVLHPPLKRVSNLIMPHPPR